MEGLGLVVVEIGNALVIDLPYHLSVCFQSWDHTISADFMQFKIKYLVSLSEALTLRFPIAVFTRVEYNTRNA
jgi:hypothetical protein